MKQLFSCAFLSLFFTCSVFQCFSKEMEFSKEPSTPPRTIRVCCAFGTNVGVMGIPYFTLSEITGIENIGKHKYMGDKEEGNGIIYTLKGGFVDMGHLRDQADWTAYLYHIIKTHRGVLNFNIKLGYEGGTKSLLLNVPNDLSEDNMKILAGRIAYDISVWHEIATWFGTSEVPFVHEQYSAFSIEDDYSNLLGTTVGIEALKSDLPYEEAMTKLIGERLAQLERVDSVSQTYDAMEKVLNKWWDRDYHFPQANVLLKRDYSTYSYTTPLIVPGLSDPKGEVCILNVPQLENTSLKFEDLYTLSFKLNIKLLTKKYFATLKKRVITSRDFLPIIADINIESNKKLAKISKFYNLN